MKKKKAGVEPLCPTASVATGEQSQKTKWTGTRQKGSSLKRERSGELHEVA